MHFPEFSFHDPTTVEEAAALLAEHAGEARLMAGGTDLLVTLKTTPMASVRHIVSLRHVAELAGIRSSATGLSLGALTTPDDLNRSADVRQRIPALLDATRELAAAQIRNMATVGGNIASAVPSADLPPILIVLNAQVVLQSKSGQRMVPLNEMFLGPRRTVAKHDEILKAIEVPNQSPRHGASFKRIANRQANACAVAGVAAGVTMDANSKVARACVVLCAVAPTPLVVKEIGEFLAGRELTEDAIVEAGRIASEAAVPISDVRSTSEYRRRIVAVLTQRALVTATERVKEAA